MGSAAMFFADADGDTLDTRPVDVPGRRRLMVRVANGGAVCYVELDAKQAAKLARHLRAFAAAVRKMEPESFAPPFPPEPQ